MAFCWGRGYPAGSTGLRRLRRSGQDAWDGGGCSAPGVQASKARGDVDRHKLEGQRYGRELILGLPSCPTGAPPDPSSQVSLSCLQAVGETRFPE